MAGPGVSRAFHDTVVENMSTVVASQADTGWLRLYRGLRRASTQHDRRGENQSHTP